MCRSGATRSMSTYAIATRPQPRRLWPEDCFIWEAADPYLYLRSTPDGRVICGGEDEDFADDEARDALIPQKAAAIRRKLGGCCRTSTPRRSSPGPAPSARPRPACPRSARCRGRRTAGPCSASAATASPTAASPPTSSTPRSPDGPIPTPTSTPSPAPAPGGDGRGRWRWRAHRPRRRCRSSRAAGAPAPSRGSGCFSAWPAPTMVFLTAFGAYSATERPACGRHQRGRCPAPGRASASPRASRLTKVCSTAASSGSWLRDDLGEALVEGEQPLRQFAIERRAGWCPRRRRPARCRAWRRSPSRCGGGRDRRRGCESHRSQRKGVDPTGGERKRRVTRELRPARRRYWATGSRGGG